MPSETGEKIALTPLRKRRLTGELYSRVPAIENLLHELGLLSPDVLVARSAVADRHSSTYVPSECLLYFVRSYRGKEPDRNYERLYKLLAERVLRRLPRPDDASGRTVSLGHSSIQEAAFDRFVELLVIDRTEYCERLDYYEVRFDGAVASLRKDARDKVLVETQRTVALESEVTGTPSVEVEYAALEGADGNVDAFDFAALDDERFRLRLDAAIDVLEPDLRRVIAMLRQGILIDSQDPSVLTIAKALGRSGRTIRTYRDKAFAILRTALPTDAP